jgi:hypothetical protein
LLYRIEEKKTSTSISNMPKKSKQQKQAQAQQQQQLAAANSVIVNVSSSVTSSSSTVASQSRSPARLTSPPRTYANDLRPFSYHHDHKPHSYVHSHAHVGRNENPTSNINAIESSQQHREGQETDALLGGKQEVERGRRRYDGVEDADGVTVTDEAFETDSDGCGSSSTDHDEPHFESAEIVRVSVGRAALD